MRNGSPWFALAMVLPLSGCCSLARLFCGPDRSPWISVDYSTPELAVRTLLEAIRRDEPEIVYQSLSSDYRQRLQVDQITMLLAWPRLRDANPGLHVAGYATVPPARLLGPDRAEVLLAIEGTPFEVQLRRERRQEMRWTRRNGTPAEPSRSVTTFVGGVSLEPDDEHDRTLVTLAPLALPGSIADLPPDEIEFVGLEAKWKVDLLQATNQP